jgi:hypothetical protein
MPLELTCIKKEFIMQCGREAILEAVALQISLQFSSVEE